jgi:hypothetical protein
MIALIDYGSGNLRSVHNALRHEGADPSLVSTANGLREADAVVLPGVGAFGDCVEGLRTRGLWEPLRDWLREGKPFLGICVAIFPSPAPSILRSSAMAVSVVFRSRHARRSMRWAGYSRASFARPRIFL